MEQLSKAQWPEGLKHIPQPPKRLYIRGAPPPPGLKLLCVVGARKNTEYGRRACRELISGLAHLPIGIVSGLAIGIDTIALETALDTHLYTLAIPGSGLANERLYPRQNYYLAQRILNSGGALVSEFEPHERAAPWMFPMRNRLMAGLCQATLMVEAEQNSGTLITARLTNEYGRDLLVVPGSIFSSHTHGPHAFLKEGATPITNAEELRSALNVTNLIDPTSLSVTQLLILDHLSQPHEYNELMCLSSGSVSEFTRAISGLELRNLIEINNGIIYKKVDKTNHLT